MKPKFTPARPKISIEDAQTAYVWGLTLDQWYALSAFEKKRRREGLTEYQKTRKTTFKNRKP